MIPNKKTARIAGAIYLVVVLTGIFSLAYVPSKLITWEDAAQTIQQLKASELLFRLSILSSAICYIAFLLLPLVLYKLLQPVNEINAKLMVAFAIVSVPISLLNLQNKYAVLSLINGTDHLNILDQKQLQSQVMFFLGNYNNGILIVQIFWGLWLLPLGYLVYHSGFLPKILGILLMLGCFGYLINFIGRTVSPDFADSSISGYIRLPASIGEIGTCLWLLLVGVKHNKTLTIDKAKTH